jgi:DNA invertase Pin-like site-specific DNA recombinase
MRRYTGACFTTSGGKLIFHIFGALAEFEREIIRERTLAGLKSARSRGRAGGRPKALTPKEVQMLRNMAKDPILTVSDICKALVSAGQPFTGM